jgi:5-methylcytosine-specific restriction endonuclease McrA
MTAAPASGPMLCAACGTRRKATTTPRKRTHEERRTSPDALARRAQARSFYSSARWRRVRDQVRERDGECLDCGTTSDLTVDHAIPRTIAPELAYEPANLRTLCRRCHGRKDGARAAAFRPRRSPLVDAQGGPSVLREGATARHGGEPSRGLYGQDIAEPVIG